MKRVLIFLAFILTTVFSYSQVQNSNLQAGLLMSVQSGPALPGTNLVTNGTFDSDLSGWTHDANVTWSSGHAVINGAGSFQQSILTNGATYHVSFIWTRTSGNLTVYLGNVAGLSITSGTSGNATITCKSDDVVFNLYSTSFVGTIDNIVIREINASALTLPNPSYTLTNSNAIPTYGHKGNASYWSFDGVDDYMDLGDNYDMGTGDFTVSFRGRWRSFSGNYIFIKYIPSPATGWGIYSSSVGSTSKLTLLFRDGSGSTTIETSATLSSNIWYDIKVVCDRDGSATWYIDGVSSGSGSIASVSGSVSNNASMLFCKYGTSYAGIDLANFSIFNYALSASDVTYYSNPANHPRLVDQTATGAVLTSGTLTTGRIYKIIDWITDDDFVNVGGTNADGTVFTATGTTPTHWAHSSTITEQGATLILSPEGMLPGIWRDAYHSIDVAVGTGSTSPRLVKEWAGMGSSWRFNGSTSYLTKASAASGLTGNLTISAWIFPTSYGGSSAGRIFDNSKIILYTSSSSSGTFGFLRDGSTGINSGSTTVTLNEWQQITVTCTSSGITDFYINGVLTGTANQSAGTPVSATTYFVGNNAGGATGFGGIIDGIQVWERILSQEEISLLYQVYQD